LKWIIIIEIFYSIATLSSIEYIMTNKHVDICNISISYIT